MDGARQDEAMASVKTQLRAAEFFAGIGLMRMGLDKEGWQTVWANDLDEKKWEMYRANFNGGYSFTKL